MTKGRYHTNGAPEGLQRQEYKGQNNTALS